MGITTEDKVVVPVLWINSEDWRAVWEWYEWELELEIMVKIM